MRISCLRRSRLIMRRGSVQAFSKNLPTVVKMWMEGAYSGMKPHANASSDGHAPGTSGSGDCDLAARKRVVRFAWACKRVNTLSLATAGKHKPAPGNRRSQCLHLAERQVFRRGKLTRRCAWTWWLLLYVVVAVLCCGCMQRTMSLGKLCWGRVRKLKVTATKPREHRARAQPSCPSGQVRRHAPTSDVMQQ